MKNANIYIFVLITIMLPLYLAPVCAYDNIYVHQQINGSAILKSRNLQESIVNIGFNNMFDYVSKKRIWQWFYEGGKLEDIPHCRARNHFHNPLEPWDDAGLNNVVLNILCASDAGDFFSASSMIWAQEQPGFIGNFWSWPKAREYYHRALTAQDQAEREDYFAKTFQALGQVMHLLSDASVPAHVRNDIHIFPLTLGKVTLGKRGTYESWVKANWRDLTYTGTQVNPSIFSQAASHAATPVLITALWDQNKYNGTNPELTHPTNPLFSDIGLAEFTNANFFSEDTIFTDYPHPAYENTTANLIERTARDGKLDKVWYVQGYTSLSLAAYSYFWDNGGLIPQGKWLYNLDSQVYRDYASQLIPRAAGYSTALLNYFFRGKMEVQPECVYRDPESDIIDIPVTIKNLSLLNPDDPESAEDMNGDLKIVYRYKQHDEDESYTYGSSDVKTGVSISYGDEFTDLFYFSKSIPLDAEVIEYTVVFHGKLGHEEDAVVAQVFSSDVEDCCTSYLVSWENSGEIHGYGVRGFEVKCKWLDMGGYLIDNCSDVDLWLMNTRIERNQLKFTLNTVLDESWDDQVILSRDFPLPDNAPFLMFAASSEPEELMYSFMIRLDYGSCPVNNGLCLLSDSNPYIKQLDLVFSPSDPYVYGGEGCWESPWEETPLRQCWIPFLPQDKPIIVNIPVVIQRMNLEMPQNIELWSSNMSGSPQEIRWGKICFMEERPDPVTFPHHYIE